MNQIMLEMAKVHITCTYISYIFAIYGSNNIYKYIDCVEITPSGKWNDISCGRAQPFLCDAPGGNRPTFRPTDRPTDRPNFGPTFRPTDRPTVRPTVRPTDRPVLFGARDYVYVSLQMPFGSANQYCRNRFGTRLATIKTPLDNARADARCVTKCYIGINDARLEGFFTNSDGTRVSYFNWAPFEPNNVGNEGIYMYVYINTVYR